MDPIEHAYLEPTEGEHSGNEAAADEDDLAQDASSSNSQSSNYTSGYDSESEAGGDDADDSLGEQDGEEGDNQAPTFMVPSRTIAALEHPFLIMDQSNALESFGPNPQYSSILDPNVPQLSVPIYLHPKVPTSRPLMSHYAASHNIVFKVTVPKRTGRKRKRGSDGPWEGEVDETVTSRDGTPSANFRSKAKLDVAKVVRRKLQDNVGRYTVEAVGIIKHTHRYRGMVDFNYSMKQNEFMNNFTDTIMSKDVAKFRKFTLKPGTDMTKNQPIIAPPLMTQVTIPNYYHYAQNPYVRAIDGPDGTVEMLNTTSKVLSVGHFISNNEPTPTAPTGRPHTRSKLFDNVVTAIKMCLAERPIWTRRSIINRICDLEFDPTQPNKRIPTGLSQQIVKNAIQFAGYQFKGGPWRDAVVRYGYDPRKEPEARFYQCLIFRLRRLAIGQMGEMWQEIRKRELNNTKITADANIHSHIFDGKKYCDDGKVWQVCDITDPLLTRLLTAATPRTTCDVDGSGWYHRGVWAKARAIMKCKMRAIQFNRVLNDADFAEALEMRDETPDTGHRSIVVPTPDLGLTDAELELVRGRQYKGVGRQRKNPRSSYHFPGNKLAKKLRKTDEEDAAVAARAEGEGGGEDDDDDDDDDVMETIENEDGVGRPRRAVHFDVVDGSDGSEDDGSEYDEDEGSEEEEEDDEEEEDEADQDELAERIRLARYDAYTDIEQGEDEDDEDQDEDEELEEQAELTEGSAKGEDDEKENGEE